MLKRRRHKQTISFKDRLADWAGRIREQAAQLPPGTEREEMLKKASLADTAAHLDDWANSPGLQPPTQSGQTGLPMQRYYFDLRDSEGLAVDEEGLVLQDVQAVQEEAALSLASVAREDRRRSDGVLNQLSVEVRTDDGPFMRVGFSFDVAAKN